MAPPAFSDDLSDDELVQLVGRVFAPRATDRALAVLVDMPDDALPDHPAWSSRRAFAAGWANRLARRRADLGLDTSLVLYRNARRNNADLPADAWVLEPPVDGATLPADADRVPGPSVPFAQVFDGHQILLAPTELSTTAPLKLAARRHGFRAATMPGFGPGMLQALRIDYAEVQRRVDALAARLDAAAGADFVFEVDGRPHHLHLDLRHRGAHASGGLLHTPGTAGNLPSGEAYIVPYEGERSGDPSRTRGTMPVELDGEVVRYRIENNRAVAVEDGGAIADRERNRLCDEPAYGNLSELGLGVLDAFGVTPIGQTLLDEKLGLHIAFGRSDHFGGQVGTADFSRPEAVVHIDRVYLPATQPQVHVARVDLVGDDGTSEPLMRDGRYV